MLALLLILLAQDPSENLSDRAIKLAQDPDANREAILKLGPAAIRPLIEVRTPELEPVLRDLKFQGSKELRAKLREHKKSWNDVKHDTQITVDVEMIASVISRMTGIPTQ